MKKQTKIIAIITVLVMIIILVVILISVFRQATPVDLDQESIVDKEEEMIKSLPNAVQSPELRIMTPEDRQQLNLHESVEAEVLERDGLGRVLSYRLLKNPIDTTTFIEAVQYIDSDNDGLLDVDEQKYGTNIYDQDSDNDGYLDGEEISQGHDPLGQDF